MRSLLVGIAGWTTILALPLTAHARYWQDASGEKVFSGQLVGLSDQAALILTSREVRKWKLSELSEADRLYLARFAEQEEEASGKSHQERMQGAWGIVYQQSGGFGSGSSEPRLAYLFEGELMQTPRGGNQKFVLRPEETPAEINLGGSFGAQPVEGIYAFVGDRLVLMLSPVGGARPVDFQVSLESALTIQILERVDTDEALRMIRKASRIPRRPGFPRPPFPPRP